MIFSRVLSSVKHLLREKFFLGEIRKRTLIPNLAGRVGVVGVPFGKGQKCPGLKEQGLVAAPDIIRSTGFIDDLQSMGLDVRDYGNIKYAVEEHTSDNMFNLDHVAPCAKEVFVQTRKVLNDSRICLTIGGDHSISAGTISGHMSLTGPDGMALIYVDAHADLNTSATSETGNIHGMHMALLCNELTCYWARRIPGLEWLLPVLSTQNFAFIALRDLDPWESFFISQHNINAYTMEDVQKHGSHVIIQKALDQIDPDQNKSIHVSFDVDSLDFFEAPCTTVPVRGGLSLREALDMTEAIHRTKRLAAIDVVEVNPLLGNEYQSQITLDAAKHVMLALFGRSRKGVPLRL